MQIGLLNPAGLPVAEAQVAGKSLDPLDVQSAFRPCGRDLVEFFSSTRWAFLVQVDYSRVARHLAAAPLA